MSKKMILISIDSMVSADLEWMKTLPNLGSLIKRSSIIKNNLTTYPSYTHSIHASISTGCYPGKHGVISNEHFEPGNLEPTWFESYKDVKVPTFQQEAHRHGYTVAEVFWPLTLGDDVEWNIHRAGTHIMPDDEQQIIRERSKPGFFDEVYPYIKDSFTHPVREYRSDALCFDTVEYLIRKHQPDLILTHLVAIDTIRHHHGVFSKELHDAYRFLDQGFGRILNALKEQGLEDQTIIAVTADHGHLDIRQVISINRFFLDNGFITLDSDNNVKTWKAWFQSCSLSGHVYISDDDPAIAEQVKNLLEENKDLLQIERVFTKEEVDAEWHLSGDFTYVLESYGNSSFSSNYLNPLFTPTNNSSYRTSLATHGHLPYKGVQPTFFVCNPFTDRQVYLPEGRIIDQAPTLASMLDFQMTTCDGHPIEELL